MPVCTARDIPAAIESAQSFLQDDIAANRIFDYSDSDVSRQTIYEIRVGKIVYPLRQQLSATFIPGRGEFLVEGLSPVFIGHGATPEAAFVDWRDNLHLRFQELLNKRRFEMDDKDRRDWSLLSDCIDTAVYRNQIPIQITQFGKITKARPIPCEITWDDGRKDAIKLEMVDSPDFVTFKAGQPLEALVARDPITFDLVYIVHIERRGEPTRLDAAEEESLLREIGSAGKLEEIDW